MNKNNLNKSCSTVAEGDGGTELELFDEGGTGAMTVVALWIIGVGVFTSISSGFLSMSLKLLHMLLDPSDCVTDGLSSK